MKKIKQAGWLLTVSVAILAASSGCKKQLDRKPLTATLDDIPGGGLSGQVLGLYNALRNDGQGGDGFNSLPYLCFHSMRSDDAIYAVDPGASSYQPWLDHFQYDKTAWFSSQYWNDHYTVIANANTALQTADSLGLTTDSLSQSLIAEAKFVRAFSYFDLVRTYGRVPLINFRVYASAQANIKKVDDVSDIYAQIDSDLTFAEAHLPLSWEDPYLGRLTSGAAKTLHAKAYLYREMWAQALQVTDDVINSGVYSLNADYFSTFTYANQNSPESIFELQGLGSKGGTVRYDVEWAEPQSPRGSDKWNLGWGWNIPENRLVNAFETGDPRKNATILFTGVGTDSASDGGVYGQTYWVPPASQLAGAAYYNKKVYTDPKVRNAFADQGSHFLNHMMYRYADVILMNAEAANETGDGAKAEADLEMIRSRARGGNSTALPMVTFSSQSQMRSAIQHERQVELGMEGERFWDVVRWHLGVTLWGGDGYADKNQFYPLPQDAVTQSNGVLVQNPDY